METTEQETPRWQVEAEFTGDPLPDETLEDLMLTLPPFATVSSQDVAGKVTAMFPASGPGIALEIFSKAFERVAPDRQIGGMRSSHWPQR